MLKRIDPQTRFFTSWGAHYEPLARMNMGNEWDYIESRMK